MTSPRTSPLRDPDEPFWFEDPSAPHAPRAAAPTRHRPQLRRGLIPGAECRSGAGEGEVSVLAHTPVVRDWLLTQLG